MIAPSCPGLDVTMASPISVVMVADLLDCVGLLVDHIGVLSAEHSNLDTSAGSAILLEALLTDPSELLLSADLEFPLALVGDEPAACGLPVGFTLPKCHCNQSRLILVPYLKVRLL